MRITLFLYQEPPPLLQQEYWESMGLPCAEGKNGDPQVPLLPMQVCMGSHLGLAVPVEGVSLEHKPAAAPAWAHKATRYLTQQKPSITVWQTQLSAGHPPAAQPRGYTCPNTADPVDEGLTSVLP